MAKTIKKRRARKKPTHYGVELLKAIKKIGLKKVDVCEKIGISRPWLNKLIVSGKFRSPEMKIVKQIIKKSKQKW